MSVMFQKRVPLEKKVFDFQESQSSVQRVGIIFVRAPNAQVLLSTVRVDLNVQFGHATQAQVLEWVEVLNPHDRLWAVLPAVKICASRIIDVWVACCGWMRKANCRCH